MNVKNFRHSRRTAPAQGFSRAAGVFCLWIAAKLEDAAWWLRDRARTPDLEMPYYPEGPEGDQ